MIVSASRKTDLPAFYGEWFRNRLRAGYCKVVQPYDPTRHRTVSLLPPEVDAFVFWTKRLGPFFPVLDEVHERGIPFLIHYTITGYPRELEPGVVDWQLAVEDCRRAAERYGPRVVWRYDPILISDLTPFAWHLDNFGQLAAALVGAVDEVVAKFVSPYRHTGRNLHELARRRRCFWYDPPLGQKRELVQWLGGLAQSHRLPFKVCCQPELLSETVEPATCIDAARLYEIARRRFRTEARGSREHCRCAASVDIGEYDTCPHGCAYCYAVSNRQTALARQRRHDPLSEYLIAPDCPAAPATQLALF